MTDGAVPLPAQRPRPPRRPLLVAVGTTTVLLTGVVGLLVARSHPALDERWLTAAVAVRGEPWDTLALALNVLGGGIVAVLVVPVVGTALLAWRRGLWPAAFFLVASAASALVVQALKIGFARARPEEMLVVSDEGSFPSGHTANAATVAVALAVILARAWVWLTGAAYAVLMALSRTYLGVHWLTDTVGGLLVGAGVALLTWAVFSLRLVTPSRPPPAVPADQPSPEVGSAEPRNYPGLPGQ